LAVLWLAVLLLFTACYASAAVFEASAFAQGDVMTTYAMYIHAPPKVASLSFDEPPAEPLPPAPEEPAEVEYPELPEALPAPEEPPVPQKRVALTFDDGPTRGNTESLLELLASYGAKATFFVVGERAEEFPHLIEQIAAAGHTIGNHTYAHKSLKLPGAAEQVKKTNDIVHAITGSTPVLLRPPYGYWYKGQTEGFGMRIVLWTVDSRDWKLKDGKLAAEVVLSTVRDGSIILFHDLREYSIEAAAIVLRSLSEQSYAFVTVEELLGL
jgi:peptidoglycan/xylan/chitin deacetylase (PgdA/CDA1 family)